MLLLVEAAGKDQRLESTLIAPCPLPSVCLHFLGSLGPIAKKDPEVSEEFLLLPAPVCSSLYVRKAQELFALQIPVVCIVEGSPDCVLLDN